MPFFAYVCCQITTIRKLKNIQCKGLHISLLPNHKQAKNSLNVSGTKADKTEQYPRTFQKYESNVKESRFTLGFSEMHDTEVSQETGGNSYQVSNNELCQLAHTGFCYYRIWYGDHHVSFPS